MKKILILFMIFALSGCEKEQPVVEPPVTQECKAVDFEYDYDSLVYDLIWSDEFDVDGSPDENKWKFVVKGDGFGNNELQYYTEENASIQDGSLIIEARKEEHLNRDYTSAKLISHNDGNFKYGKIEVRAKLPSGRGTWPAVWMMPTLSIYGGWPRSGEIDIMEHVGYDMNKIHGSSHMSSYNRTNNKGGSVYVENVSEEFHVYSLEWLPDMLIYYVDGEEYYRYEPSKYNDCPTREQWPFDHEFYLILNIAVGGDWGGAHGIDDSIWPQTMEIDYVRVYQSETINNIGVD